MRQAWAPASERYPNYELVVPGSPSFICLVGDCPENCCTLFSVSLGEREAARMERRSGLPRRAFLEWVDDGPLVVPLAQPYLLSRREGQCTQLGEHGACSQYAGRPDACRLYPHF